MVGAVDKLDAHVLDRVAGQNAGVQSLLDALVDGGDVLLRHDTADDLVLELVALARLGGVHVDDAVAVLAATAGLADELALNVEGRRGGLLAISNLGLTNVSLNLELTQQTVDDDLEVQLAHASDDGLAGLVVGGHLERGVLLGELLQGDGHLVLLGLGLRLDGDVDNRVGELHGLEDDGRVLGAEGVTSGGVLQADDRDDIASGAAVDVDALVGVHLQKTADTLLLILHRVDDVAASVKLAGVHTQVGKLADVGVGHDLEGQSRERSLHVGGTLVLFLGAGDDALDGGHVDRRRHVVDHGVEQLLHALVLVGRTHEHGMQLAGDGALADGGLELLDGVLFLHQDLLHQFVVAISGGVDELLMTDLGLIGELGRNLGHGLGVGHALVIGVEVPCGHGHQVDDAPEVVLGAHGHLSGNRRSVQAVLHGLNGVEEVCADTVVLVDVRDARNAITVGLTPNGLGLRLNASDSVEDRDSAVENAQGALDLGGEVNVAGGIDDLEAIFLTALSTTRVLPEARGGSCGDGNAALLLLDHPVHGSSAVVNLADLMSLASVIQDALSGGSLARVDVGHDTNVARIPQINFRHCSSSLPVLRSGSERRRGWPRPSCTCPRAS